MLFRSESLKTWAKRIGVSVPTLLRLEAGEPSVSLGVLATALWLIGRDAALGDLAERIDGDRLLGQRRSFNAADYATVRASRRRSPFSR